MLKNITRGEWITEIDYALEYTDGRGNGFSFPCDERGDVGEQNPAAAENLKWCKQHPERFKVCGEVRKYRRQYRTPTTGTCGCGEEVELWDQYMGACECPKCGRWYNLFGQELLPPEHWEE